MVSNSDDNDGWNCIDENTTEKIKQEETCNLGTNIGDRKREKNTEYFLSVFLLVLIFSKPNLHLCFLN